MRFILSISILFLISNISFCQRYKPLDAGSKVHFVIKNFGIKTGGDFTGLNGEIVFDPEAVDHSHLDVTVKSSTVNTDNSMRDNSLRADYFESEKFPEIRISGKKIEKTNKTADGIYYFTGNLIIKGISKNISFPFKAEKRGNDYLFTADFEINRLDYNVGSKSAVLGNLVNISLSVVAKKS